MYIYIYIHTHIYHLYLSEQTQTNLNRIPASPIPVMPLKRDRHCCATAAAFNGTAR